MSQNDLVFPPSAFIMLLWPFLSSFQVEDVAAAGAAGAAAVEVVEEEAAMMAVRI